MLNIKEAMTFDEIANALGLKRTGVEYIYANAIKKLRQHPDSKILLDFLTEQPDESTNRNNSHYDRH